MLITFSELARRYQKDTSHIAKLVKASGIEVTLVKSEGKACKAINKSDLTALESRYPSLSYDTLSDSDIEVTVVALERKQDISGLLKFLKRNNFKLEKRLREGGRPVNVLSKSEYKRLTKEHPPRTIVNK